ncbi:ABC transporter permease subunit [Azospirillum brasilense]|uniref:ABC transporter permease n=1 Tax=Azospirillum brasilense TaxID=192 RepID=UPI00157AD974|nr:ABC transporter permease [Azospirillum brasilense]NUB28458.1 ABC transporter permease subunit [Azospirillum brasilense]
MLGRRHAIRGAGLLVSVALTVLGLLLVTFLIGRVVPIDPVIAVVGDRVSADTYARVRQELGLDLPLWQQFLRYVGDVLQGDFGTSVLTSRPVLEDILRVFPATLELATAALVVGVLLGIPAGVMAAVHRGRWPDHLIRVIGLIGHSIPIFWLGLMALLVFYARLDWAPGPGRVDVFYEGLVDPVTGIITADALLAGESDVFWNALPHLVLPAGILGLYSVAYIARMTRSFMLDQLRQEYITTARVKGMSEARVIWRHALGNIAVPLTTVVALSYASLLEGSVLTETVFAWPGLGLYITNSLLSADMNAVLGGTLVVGAVFIGLNLLSDLLYRLLDPRAR